MSVTSPLATSRRNTELGLILMAGLITGSAYTLSALGRDSNIPANLVGFVLFVMGLLVTAHIATRYLAAAPTACCCRWPRSSTASAT